MKARQGFKKGIAFVLMLAMVIGTFGIAGWGTGEAYAAEESIAAVRIIDENNNAVITDEAVSIESGITTLGAIVAEACQNEGRIFELSTYGFPSAIGGVELSEGAYWISMLNDSGSAFSTGSDFANITASAGDRIVLYADTYPSNKSYAYFTVMPNGTVNVMQYGEKSYITGNVTLKLQTDAWGVVAPCAGTNLVLTDQNGLLLNTANFDFGLPPDMSIEPITSDDGTITIDLYGTCNTADEATYEKTFIISSNDSGLIKPYCKVVLTSTGMSFSQPIDSSGYEPEDPVVTHIDDITGDINSVIDGIQDASDSHDAYYYDNDWALGMISARLSPTQTEKDNYLAWVVNSLSSQATSRATKAKTALALTGLGIDARQVPDKNTGEPIDLIKTVAYSDPSEIDAVYEAPFLLSLYDLGIYDIPSDALITREMLIETILAGQGSDYWGEYGADGTGTVLLALAPYYNADVAVNGLNVASCGAITDVINGAVTYLSSLMGEYGAFSGFGGSLNANTQAIVVTALHALAIDTHKSDGFCKSASAMDNLLSFRTSDNKLGYSSNDVADDFASKQGLWALATYRNLKSNGNGNLYNFTASVSTYTEWPDADLLTGITLTTNKTKYNLGESIDPATIKVNAIYNGDASTGTPISISDCTVTPGADFIFDKTGNATVTVSYLGQSATYVISVTDPNNGVVETQDYVSVKIKDDKGKLIAAESNLLIEPGVTTALDALRYTAENNDIGIVIIGGSYVSAINGLGEFELGENAGWLYKVNGTTPPTTAARQYHLEAGDEVLWYYTTDYTTDSSSSAWTQANAVLTDITEVKVNESNGAATATLSKSELQEMAEAGNAISFKSTLATVEMDSDTVTGLSKAVSGSLELTASKVDPSSLKNVSDEVKSQIGDRPTIALSITSAGNIISNFAGEVTVRIPYLLAAGENPNAIIIYWLNETGGSQIIRNCRYDEKTKSVIFTTDHFSNYAVGYQLKGFTDIKGNWAADFIYYLAARDMIAGMNDAIFAPNANITRAQFVQLLANMAEVDLTSYGAVSTTTFKDVNAGSWYAPAVSWAAEEGVVLGFTNSDGTLLFNPSDTITRQDMAVMLLRYMSEIQGVEVATQKTAVAFDDEHKIAAYAKGAVDKMSAAGVINGKTATQFAPSDQATRAEAAKMICMLQSEYL